jgi:UDP-N-acetylglucosamine 3-dehydrogenase
MEHSMKRLRIGVAGAGIFGETHVATIQTLSGVEVTAVCDPKEGRAASVARKYGIPSYFADCQTMLESAHVDILDVVTPEDRHVEPCLLGIDAGKDLFIEKPIASTLEEADTIIQAASRDKVIAIVGHILRFDQRFIWGKDWIEAGNAGAVASFYGRKNVSRESVSLYQRVSLPLASSIHHYDLARWYLADEAATIYCVEHTSPESTVPDTSWVTIQFQSGAVAVIESVWLIPTGAPNYLDTRIEVIGSKGTLQIDDHYQGVAAWSAGHTEFPRASIIHRNVHSSLRREWEYFLDCVRTRRQPQVITLEDARAALRIGVLAQESAKTGRVIIA